MVEKTVNDWLVYIWSDLIKFVCVTNSLPLTENDKVGEGNSFRVIFVKSYIRSLG